MGVSVTKLKYIPIGDQSKSDFGFYETEVWNENIGMYEYNGHRYDVCFTTLSCDMYGEVNPRAVTIKRQGVLISGHLETELVKLFLPYLQEELDKVV